MAAFSIREILKNVLNIPGWHSSRKIVVIESDDWGSIRMPSIKTFEEMKQRGLDLSADEGSRYNKYDSFATGKDLSLLFEVLDSVKDATGRPAVLNPIAVVANPDFRKIHDSGFSEYYYEPFTTTLESYPDCSDSFGFWKEGISKRLFVPQFHGREHLNVKAWMRALKQGNRELLLAFENNMWGVSTANDPDIRLEVQAAFDFMDCDDLEYQEEVIKSGLDLFHELFGYRASYFVPPNGPFSSKLEPVCYSKGIKYLFSSQIHHEPAGNGKINKKLCIPGRTNRNGLTYLTRNCFFEPGVEGIDWVDSCMNEIENAFKWKKPAVISSHRVNYIGALYESNRDNGLGQLATLLKLIKKKWPEVEFLTSEELGQIFRKSNQDL